MRDDSVRASLALCNKTGRFLFEVRPDLFPQGYLTDLELEMWGEYLGEVHRG